MYTILGLKKQRVYTPAESAQQALNSALVFWPEDVVYRIVKEDGETVHVRATTKQSAYAACDAWIATLPRDPRAACETKHALSALKKVGNNATAREWGLALAIKRSVCPRCDYDARKSSGRKYTGKQIVNKVVTFAPKSRGRAHFDCMNMGFAVGDYSRRGGR